MGHELKKMRQWRNMIIAVLLAGSAGGGMVGVISYYIYREPEIIPPIETESVLQEEPVEEPEIISVSALEKIINVSELSSYTVIYKGVETVYNAEKPENIDYYVKYKAAVDAGIDIQQIEVMVDHDLKEIRITLPDATISDYAVEIESLEFMFYNDKVNQLEITQAAYAACEKDVRDECSSEQSILDLAKQNAMNIIRALTEPIVAQLDEEYVLYVS